ncbi:MAG TPA: pyruvate kinase [Vicinamibacterales bacterium]|jgi:pyruvate kinase|nr:pyruvate kinase [Vicinamibacterales bacterium]
MRRTRILATIGPASNDAPTIQALIAAGADAFRLNFSHGNADAHAETCRGIRAVAEAMGRDVAILQDLGGPKIRTGPLNEPIVLAAGDHLTIDHGEFVGAHGRIACSFEALFSSVSPGDRLLIDDGRIELDVETAAADRIIARAITGGQIHGGKGINVPTAALKTSALTEKDRRDLVAGIAMGVDLVAVSFVQSARDMVDVRTAATAAGAPGLPLIAKIEKPRAVDHIDDIIAVSDGLMVARGDLGVEVPLETLPAVQKRIVQAARRRGVPVILATQVLESMRTDPRPTRAEVTDAAHAVDERVDAIMLAGETASGAYPVRAVTVLDAIIREAEKTQTHPLGSVPEGGPWSAHSRALCEAAVALASRAHAKVIVAMTKAGKTAHLLAALRPEARILAVTPRREIAAALALVWGVTPVVTEHRAIGTVRQHLLMQNQVSAGDVIVFVSAHAMLGHENINFVHVEQV